MLNLAGMSMDESEHEGQNGAATYYIRNKDWRSKKITEWLRMLDSLHLRLRYRGEWEASPGAWPHMRLISLRESLGHVVPGLPVEFYDRYWYASQNDFAQGELRARETASSLDLPVSIQK